MFFFKRLSAKLINEGFGGFMGTTDGGRIKVTVNCEGSAEFMRENNVNVPTQ